MGESLQHLIIAAEALYTAHIYNSLFITSQQENAAQNYLHPSDDGHLGRYCITTSASKAYRDDHSRVPVSRQSSVAKLSMCVKNSVPSATYRGSALACLIKKSAWDFT